MSAFRTPIRALAMSMIEVMIAMAILVTIVGMAMDVVIGTNATTAMTEAKDRLNREAVDVINLMSDDVAQSTWLYFDTTVTPDPVLDVSTTALQATVDDTTRRYYPYINIQNNGAAIGGMGPDFPHLARNANMVALSGLPGNLPGSASDATTLFTAANRATYLSSFFARSQEMVFARLTTTPWASEPSAQRSSTMLFPNGDWSGTNVSSANRAAIQVLYPSGWSPVYTGPDITSYNERTPGVPYGVLLSSTELKLVNNEPQIRPNYETVDVPDTNPDTNQYPREYTYAVVPSPVGGLGRLVRAYSVRMAAVTAPVAGTDPGQFITPLPTANLFGLRVDRVLSDNCVRVVFDTYRTEPIPAVGQVGLGAYDVRVRLFMARRSSANSQLVIYRMLESVLTMRGRTGEADRANDATKLGSPVVLTY